MVQTVQIDRSYNSPIEIFSWPCSVSIRKFILKLNSAKLDISYENERNWFRGKRK